MFKPSRIFLPWGFFNCSLFTLACPCTTIEMHKANAYQHILSCPFLTEKAQSAVATTQTGGYINPTKLESGGSVRFALLDDQPLEFFEVWGESEGKLKPFRFADSPTTEDVEIEMGNEFTRRMNREGTGVEPAKFGIAVPVFNHDSQKVEIFSATQKGIIKEFDKISQMEDYSDLLAWDFVLSREGTGLKTEYSLRAVPRKKGTSSFNRSYLSGTKR